jgi:hypothetical protein
MADILPLVGSISGGLITVGGTTYLAFLQHQLAQRKRSPVIEKPELWGSIVGAQRRALVLVADQLREDDSRNTRPWDSWYEFDSGDAESLLTLRQGAAALDFYRRAERASARCRPFRKGEPTRARSVYRWTTAANRRRRLAVRRHLRQARDELVEISYLDPKLLMLRENNGNEERQAPGVHGDRASAEDSVLTL